VGGLTDSLSTSALTSNPAGAFLSSSLYGWNGSTYVNPTAIMPGKGYWVFVGSPCTLTLTAPAAPVPPPAASASKVAVSSVMAGSK
jgi:hypothetical protein